MRLSGVGKRFDNGLDAVHDLSLTVAADEFVAIVGASGCGKSTLLRIIAGLVPGTSGSVEVHGEKVTAPRADVGMMFQRPALLEWRTALENVLLPVRMHRGIGGDDVAEAARLLRLFHLSGFEHHFPRQLSGGMQQRVALARLLMSGAKVRLLDEPFGALDELTRELLNTQLAEIHGRAASATILVTHSVSEAVLLADRVVVMTARPGTIAADVAIPLPRPRPISVVHTPEFQELALTVRDGLGRVRAEGGCPE
ncbi:ABC transporter ATP-binding protein [Spongiactinospora sp. TRM90649]|uniref:ABC transporter ATP-binding protein n=1 Tax=Spongiactinospora sp. TRM90649 TaxID=3031114 RepID=UPI0023F739BF|nr:ABC transporter ATP-binding protein [Spongiactinospora sp. TRM90649]MDF5753577.1 ABC transporter ATP-binding protein [Spongiactinospora sp. TRM90649]